jgi:ribonuclease HI
MDHIQIFTDSSGQNGSIGAAAVLTHEGKAPCTLHFYLGTDEEHTVYEAEAVGLTLAAHLLATEQQMTFPASILADNQAVLKHSESTTPKAGHYLIEHFNRIMDSIKKSNQRRCFSVTIHWIAAHSEVIGNKLADEEAKRAAEGNQNNSTAADLPQYLSSSQLPDSISAIKQAHMKSTKLRWECLWSKSPRYARTTVIDPNILSCSFIKLVANLPK